ncbi:ATP-binding protein [Lentzea sp. NPDC051213]|uniref:ATP-binding protein n=1 Tax=Lentzea sp. NPDC051213 TaxID=3364126 RepID=UPI0037BA8EB6
MDASLGDLLRRHRVAAGLTQEALAERAGLSTQAISTLERGTRRYPHRDTVLRLAGALGLGGAEQTALVTAATRRSTPKPAGQKTAAAQLPPAVSGFSGRADVLPVLDALLAEHESSHAVVVSAIAGTAGIGKTTLAIHWAHRARARFPDGQLFLNLRGHGGGPPLTPLEALSQLLAGLGMELSAVPQDVEAAAATYRTLLNGKRVLVVLDDAVDASQVRPLLPGSPTCLAIVTSRYRLDGLVARDGARRLVLDVLSPAEARALLAHVLGADRIAAEPAAVDELVELCARLPLALRIAAAHLLNGLGTIASYVAALRSGDRLTSLEVPGDPDTAVRAAFALSYSALDEPQRRLFRLMGLMPGRDLTADGAAALARLDEAETGRCLRALTAAHLVDEHQPGRFTFHDLLRLYAGERARAEESAADCDAAVERLCGHYAMATVAAVQLVDPRPFRQAVEGVVPFKNEISANEWLDVETDNLVAATKAAAQHGLSRLAVQLSVALHPQFERHRTDQIWLETATATLGAAERVGDLRGQAHALQLIGHAHWSRCDYEQSLAYLERARAIIEELGDAELYPSVLGALGRTSISMGRPRDCAVYYQQALELHEQAGHVPSVSVLAVLGDAYWELGELTRSYELHTEAIAVAHRIGVRWGVLLGETHAGRSCQALGELDRAIEHYQAGLVLCREFGEPAEEAGNLANLSGAYRDREKYDDALHAAEQALAIATRLGMRRTQISAWHVLGSTHLLLGDDERARVELRTALDLATAASHLRGRGDALLSLAALHLRDGEPDAARALAREALELSRGSGHQLVEGESLRVLAEADLAQNLLADARSQAEEAKALHERCGYRLGAARAADTLRRI